MRRFWEKFDVVNGQVTVEYVQVLRRSHGVLVFELGTVQKYAQALGYSGSELHLVLPEYAPGTPCTEEKAATSVVFPRSLWGWDLVVPLQGRYSLVAALYKPGRGRGENVMVTRDQNWRTALLTQANP